MKKNFLWLLLAVLLLGLVIGAAVLYDKFSEEYAGNNLMVETPESYNTVSTERPTQDTTPVDFSAPDFTVLDQNGNPVKLSDHVGKPIVLNFWATWCTYCVQEMPDFDAMQKQYPDVQFMMINATTTNGETMEDAKAFVDNYGYSFDVFFDTQGQAIRAYEITSYPTTFFIDAQGNLVARGSGMLNADSLAQGIQMIYQGE